MKYITTQQIINVICNTFDKEYNEDNQAFECSETVNGYDFYCDFDLGLTDFGTINYLLIDNFDLYKYGEKLDLIVTENEYQIIEKSVTNHVRNLLQEEMKTSDLKREVQKYN